MTFDFAMEPTKVCDARIYVIQDSQSYEDGPTLFMDVLIPFSVRIKGPAKHTYSLLEGSMKSLFT